jgi:CBS domain-containing protein/Zn-dependent protease
MRGWSIPLGRWMGVEFRIHAFFPLLAVVCLALSGSDGVARGLGLFLVITAAVVVRETARLLVAAWLGLRLRAVLLLPIGGLFAYANPESQENANRGAGQFAIALAGPLANGATALVLAAAFLGASGDIRLLDQPLITSAALLRSMVWMQVFMGAIHLLPAYPLDCGRLIRGSFARKHGLALSARAATGLGQVIALAAVVGGMLLHEYWLSIAGFFIMIGAQIEDQGVFFQSVVDTVLMREVMLTDFATLSPSDTLTDALVRCVHSLQEDFPVVRGPELVGIVSRQRIVDALRNDGNGYVQAVMSRAFQVARPEDTLGTTIRRLTAGRGLALIPITESGRVVGIVSVQNLMSSMSLLAEQRRIERPKRGQTASRIKSPSLMQRAAQLLRHAKQYRAASSSLRAQSHRRACTESGWLWPLLRDCG